METAADAWLRWTRAAALAGVAVLVAVWAHVGADGRLPSAAVLLLVVVAMTAAAQPLLARPASPSRVLLLTVGGQAAAHAVLSLAAGHRGEPRSVGSPAVASRTVASHNRSTDHAESGLADGALALLDLAAHLLDDLASAGVPMVITHLVAAALVGGWLAAGERAVWTLLTLAWRALQLLVAAVRPVVRVPRAAGTTVVAPLVRRVTAASVVRRGPPSLLAA